MKYRDKFEIWCDRHNHKMGLVRTLVGLLILGLQLYLIISHMK